MDMLLLIADEFLLGILFKAISSVWPMICLVFFSLSLVRRPHTRLGQGLVFDDEIVGMA